MNSISPQMLGLANGSVTLMTPATGGSGLKRLFRAAVRRRGVLVGSLIAGATLGLVITLATPRQYTSTLQLQVARETAQIVNLGALSHDVSIGDQEFYQTQYNLLKTRALAERVAHDLNAADDPAFFAAFHKSADFNGAPGQADEPARLRLAGQILLKHVLVAPIHGSSLVNIEASSSSPQLSTRIADTWGRDFIASSLDRRQAASGYARQFLQNSLDQLREKLEVSERQAVEYAAAHGIVDLSAAKPGEPQSADDVGQAHSLLTDDLVAFNGALERATAARIAAASQLAAASAEPDANSEALNYRAIGRLREQRAAVAADYAKLAADAGATSPEAKALHAKLDTLDTAIQAESVRVRTSILQIYQGSLGQEQTLTKKVATLKDALADLRRRSIQYTLYKRDADTNRELYNAVLQRYKEIGVAGGAETNNVAIVDAAAVPDQPSSPRLSLNLVLFGLAGLIVGAVVASVLEQVDGEPEEEAPNGID